MNAWQPIDTIPKDQFVLIYAEDNGRTKQFVGKFDIVGTGGYLCFLSNDIWEYPVSMDNKSLPIKEISIVCKATHWMPLPEPPTQ